MSEASAGVGGPLRVSTQLVPQPDHHLGGHGTAAAVSARQILAEATVNHDRVLVDAPPLDRSLDALTWAREVDEVVLVVPAGRVPVEDLQHQFSILQALKPGALHTLVETRVSRWPWAR